MLAERSVPRYTSYPTAPHFSPSIDAAAYGRWLAELPADASLSIYLHVPYCVALCNYCGCQTKAVRSREPVEAYADLLSEEFRLVGAATGARTVHRIHWGGGTPSILGPRALLFLADELSRSFDLTGVREHAIELDPRYVTAELADALVRMGVNRASLGIQDLSPHVQEAIGRIQPFDVVADAVAQLRKAGITRLNFDLMYGLPRQSVGDAIRSATLAASLEPARLAVFGYAHVPWLKPHQRLIASDSLPGAAERLTQFEQIRRALTGAGYRPVGLDHFALADDELAAAAAATRLRRNFQGYTTDQSDALLGFGASAIGLLPQGYVQNAHDAAGYGRKIGMGEFATSRGLRLSHEDRVRGRIIERLMCDFAVDLDAIEDKFDQEPGGFAAEIGALAGFAGFVEINGRRVTITPQGRPFARLVAAEFDAYLPKGRARHSCAV
jgi:oxygen-independent coproporphyrinogen-3 oxidase